MTCHGLSAVFRGFVRARAPGCGRRPEAAVYWNEEQSRRLGLVRQQMADLSSADWMDGVVPVTVKPMGRELEGGELLIGDGAALRIGPAIQLAPHAQAGGCPRGADQVDGSRPDSPAAARASCG